MARNRKFNKGDRAMHTGSTRVRGKVTSFYKDTWSGAYYYYITPRGKNRPSVCARADYVEAY